MRPFAGYQEPARRSVQISSCSEPRRGVDEERLTMFRKSRAGRQYMETNMPMPLSCADVSTLTRAVR
jgi:hypothetical protein